MATKRMSAVQPTKLRSVRAAKPAAALATKPAAAAEHPRLGLVMRFAPGAAAPGIRRMEQGGFRVASSKDFKSVASVPNDFGGADVQYFERFGIAIVRSSTAKLNAMLRTGAEHPGASSVRQERIYRPAGQPMGYPSTPIPLTRSTTVSGASTRDFLMGYRAGVDQLIEALLRESQDDPDALFSAAARFDELTVAWGIEAIKANSSTLTGAGIRIAVLDTGFDHTHPDFAGRKVTKKLFASKSSPDDIHGHGTHCIGTACGPLRPSHGPRYGIAHEAEIYAGKVLGDDGFGTDRSIIAGMDWALEQGCHIISMSLGAATQLGDAPNDDYEQIGKVCLDAGTLVVAAAGNESQRPAFIAPVGSPANASTFMAVAAVDRAYAPAAFSCGGMNPGQDIDIAAPGVEVLSSLPGGQYARWNGTSMATPHVAGVAALLAQSNPSYRGWALWARLLQTSRRLPGKARDVGRGLLVAPQRR